MRLPIILGLLHIITPVITMVLRIGRFLALTALGVMVMAILAQVFFRYVLSNPLPWPEEAARFLMLWMTGLIAPSAYRWGGFVAIDMLEQALSKMLAAVLQLLLLAMSLCVLIVGVGYAFDHTFGFGGNFNSSSLRLPLDWFGGESVRVKLRYMYASMFVCSVLLLVVNIELILRSIYHIAGGSGTLPADPDHTVAAAD